jgi:signal transduction histidine kinase
MTRKLKTAGKAEDPSSSPGIQASPRKISERLEDAYASLKNRYKGLNAELEETHAKLINKFLELDLLTQYLDSILSNISQGVIVLNDEGEVTTYNAAAENILKVPRKKVLFHKFWDSFADGYLGFSIRAALKEKQCPKTLITKIEPPSSDSSDLEVDINLLARPSGEETDGTAPDNTAQAMRGLIILVRDVTEYKKLQALAQRKSRMNELGEMASMVAHEIRNPLGGIKGFASLLERDLADRPALQKIASHITQGTDNLNELVTRVLNYAHPPLIQMKPTDVVHLLHELRKHLLTDESLCQNAHISLKCSEKSLFMPVDPYALHSCLLNLVLNALQAMPKGGDVTISLEKSPTHAILKVADTGIGIPKENLKKIFSPFFTTRPDGHGFGLSEAYKVIEAHEGTIEVNSIVNRGTTFLVKLPLTQSG